MTKAQEHPASASAVARSALTRALRAALLGTGAALAPAARAEGGKGGPVATRFPASARAQGKVDRVSGFAAATRAQGKKVERMPGAGPAARAHGN